MCVAQLDCAEEEDSRGGGLMNNCVGAGGCGVVDMNI